MFFWTGMFIGAVFMWLASAYQNYLYRKILIGKANPDNRTAECIDGKFFYIIPEKEYVDMVAQKREWDDADEQFAEEDRLMAEAEDGLAEVSEDDDNLN